MIIQFHLHLNPTCYFIIQCMGFEDICCKLLGDITCPYPVSAGPLGSRAAKAIGFIEKMIEYSYVNAPLQKELLAGRNYLLSVCLYWDAYLSTEGHL